MNPRCVCVFNTSSVCTPVSIFVSVLLFVITATTVSPCRPVDCGRWQGSVGFEPSTLPLLMPRSAPQSYAEPACRAGCGAAVFVCVCVWECVSVCYI